MKSLSHRLILTALLITSIPNTFAQSYYQHQFFSGAGPDQVDLDTGALQMTFPVIDKPGRGVPATFAMSYQGNFWTSVYGQLEPGSFGWNFNLYQQPGSFSIQGYYQDYCGTDVDGNDLFIDTTNERTYVDALGATHNFSGEEVYNECTNTETESWPEWASGDGGYTIDQFSNVYDQHGNSVWINQQDSNGNKVVMGADSRCSSAFGISGCVIDTTGRAVVTEDTIGSLGFASHYYYIDTTGTKQTITINYTSYTVQTNFGLHNQSEYGPQSQSLPSSIVYPDGSTYSFTYEATPGHSGSVTGRIATVTLPTGGVISYTYPSTNDGLFLDQTSTGISRTTTDGTITIARTEPTSTGVQTVITYPSSRTETYNFTSPGLGYSYYLTTGVAASGITTTICYQTSSSGCTGDGFEGLIAQRTLTTTLDNGLYDSTTEFYTLRGVLSERDESDFTASGTPPLLRKTLFSYSSAFDNKVDRVTAVVVEDPSNNVVSQTNYVYDGTAAVTTSGLPNHTVPSTAPGNLTQVSQWNSADPTHWLTTNYTVDDAGQVLAMSGPGPGQTTLSYDSTDSYVTQITYPSVGSVTLTTQSQYDMNTGLPTSVTDENAHKTLYTYDSSLRMSTSTRDTSTGGDGEVTTYTYPSHNQTNVASTIGNGYSTNTEILVDAYGRSTRAANASGLTSTPWFIVDTCYDSDGRKVFTSLPYAASGTSGSAVCSGSGDQTSYDSLGRPSSLTHADGSSIVYAYKGRAMKSTDEGAGSVHNVRVVQSDGLGRPSIICEYSNGADLVASPSAGSCGTDLNVAGGDPTATGYVSQYTYNLASRTVSVSQSGANRTWQYDSLGRLISEQIPERQGATTLAYSFNSTGLQTTRTRVGPNQAWGVASPTYVTATTQTDALYRPVSTSYNDGVTPTVSYAYDTGGTSPATHNMFGNLASASVGSITDLFSYTSNGQIEWEQTCLASTCGSGSPSLIMQSFQYDLLGQITSASDGAVRTIGYQYNSVAQLGQVTESSSDSTHPANILSSITYSALGVSSFTHGNGLNGQLAYDSRGRINGLQIQTSAPANVYSYSLSWAGNGSLMHSADSQNDTWTYRYDEFNRLASASKDSGTQGFSYQYDIWGNLNNQTVTAGSGFTISHAFDTAHSNHVTAYSYDAAGDVLSDGFHSYTYDPEGRILTVDSTTAYTYGPAGDRVQVSRSTGSTNYIYTPEGQLSTIWNGTTLVKANIYVGGAKEAHYDTTGTYFEYADWTGSTRIVTDHTGSVTQSFTSVPFNMLSPSGTASDQAEVAGLDWDAESQSGHAWARQYSPRSGMWLTPDPYNGSYDFANPQSFNRYVYVGNDPMSYSDPSGLARFEGGTNGFGLDETMYGMTGSSSDRPCPNREQSCSDFSTVSRWLHSFLGFLGSLGGNNPPPPPDDGYGGLASRFVTSTLFVVAQGPRQVAQKQNQTPPANANMNVVLFAGYPPKANHSENNGAFFVVQWNALKLDKNGAVIPHFDSNTGLYNSTPRGEITLQENQGAGFTGQYSGHGDVGSTSDNIIAGHPPFLQRWSIGGQPVRVVIGGTASHPVLAWTVKVTVTSNGPVYSAAP